MRPLIFIISQKSFIFGGKSKVFRAYKDTENILPMYFKNRRREAGKEEKEEGEKKKE